MVKKGNVDVFLKEVIREAQEINIPVSSSISENVLINPRPKRRFGCCKRQGRRFTIEISQFILNGDEKTVKTVLAHEVLHTCGGSYEHGAVWKQYAAAMSRAYGYNIKRTTSFAEMGLEEPARADDRIRYIIRCQKCGREYPRQKFTCVMKKINAYRCTCGGRLEWMEVKKK